MSKRAKWLAILCTAAGLSLSEEKAAPARSLKDRLVLAYHYPWYGYKGKSWDEQPGILDHPLLGSYRSDDPQLIDFQLSLAEEAGLDAFIVSWSGADSAPGRILEEILEMLRKPPERRLKLCLCVEHLANTPKLAPEKLELALGQALEDYGSQPGYLRVDGKPVLFIYQAQSLPLESWRTVIGALTKAHGAAWYIAVPDGWEVDLECLSVLDGLVPYADKYYGDEALRKSYRRVFQRVRPLGKPAIAAAIGGGSRIQKLGFDIDRSQGRYLRRRFQLAMELQADWVAITSWNEWFEAMQIEPSREHGFEQIRHVRELSAAFKGKDPAPLDGAELSAAQTGAAPDKKLLVTNTGKRTVYNVVAASGGKKRQTVAYLLHPGQSAAAAPAGEVEEVIGFQPDGTAIRCRPK